jgi:hypothetical protein
VDEREEIIAMAAGYRNGNLKHLLSEAALDHLKSIEYGIDECKICLNDKQFDYDDFVDLTLKVILILRNRDKEKSKQQKE